MKYNKDSPIQAMVDKFEGRPSMYQMIADEKELEWFFNHVIFRPLPYESYSMVFVSRHKKLTKEEQETIGLTRKEREFLDVQVVRSPKINHVHTEKEKLFTFENFLRHVRRFNVDKYAYTTALGEPLPEKTLAVLIYINPADDIKVADKIIETIEANKTAIVKAGLTHDHDRWSDVLPIYQNFSNLDGNIKHYKAQCKGSVYWMDYDIDVPAWFKNAYDVHGVECFTMNENGVYEETNYYKSKTCLLISYPYYKLLAKLLKEKFGKGNYVIVDTSGGYHVLVRTHVIKSNPHDLCKEVEEIYRQGLADGNESYVDEKGVCKFECVVNDSQIPGLPLPGTYQYGRPVTVVNKEDFE